MVTLVTYKTVVRTRVQEAFQYSPANLVPPGCISCLFNPSYRLTRAYCCAERNGVSCYGNVGEKRNPRF